MKKKINRRDWLDLWKVINKKCVDEPRRVNSGLSHDCCVIFEKSIGRRLEEVVVVVHSSPRLGKRLLLFTSSCLAIQQHVYFFPSRSSLWCLPPTSSLLSILPPPLSLFPLFLSFFSFLLPSSVPFHHALCSSIQINHWCTSIKWKSCTLFLLAVQSDDAHSASQYNKR